MRFILPFLAETAGWIRSRQGFIDSTNKSLGQITRPEMYKSPYKKVVRTGRLKCDEVRNLPRYWTQMRLRSSCRAPFPETSFPPVIAFGDRTATTKYWTEQGTAPYCSRQFSGVEKI